MQCSRVLLYLRGEKIGKLFIASYYRQLSADIKMKTYKIKTSFVSPEGPKARLT